MDVVLLDTSVVSLLHPKKKNTELRAKYELHMRDRVLALSFQSVAELWEWAENNNWGQKSRDRLETFLRRFLILPYNYELAKVWARVMNRSRRDGRRLEAGDCWIAATAVLYAIPLITHDRHLTGLPISGLEVISYCDSVV